MGVLRSKQPLPASVRNVESMFCSMCQRIKAGPCGCDAQSLDYCPVLKTVAAPAGTEKVVDIRRSPTLPDSVCDFAAYRLCTDRRHVADGACRIPAMPAN